MFCTFVPSINGATVAANKAVTSNHQGHSFGVVCIKSEDMLDRIGVVCHA